MVRNWPCEMMVFNEQMEVESRNSTDTVARGVSRSLQNYATANCGPKHC